MTPPEPQTYYDPIIGEYDPLAMTPGPQGPPAAAKAIPPRHVVEDYLKEGYTLAGVASRLATNPQYAGLTQSDLAAAYPDLVPALKPPSTTSGSGTLHYAPDGKAYRFNAATGQYDPEPIFDRPVAAEGVGGGGAAPAAPSLGQNVNALNWALQNQIITPEQYSVGLSRALGLEDAGGQQTNYGTEVNRLLLALQLGAIDEAQLRSLMGDLVTGRRNVGLEPIPGYPGRFLTPNGQVADLREERERNVQPTPFAGYKDVFVTADGRIVDLRTPEPPPGAIDKETQARLRGLMGFVGGTPELYEGEKVESSLGRGGFEVSGGAAGAGRGAIGGGGNIKTVAQVQAEKDMYALQSGQYIPGLSEAVFGPGGYLTRSANPAVTPVLMPSAYGGVNPAAPSEFATQREAVNFATAGGPPLLAAAQQQTAAAAGGVGDVIGGVPRLLTPEEEEERRRREAEAAAEGVGNVISAARGFFGTTTRPTTFMTSEQGQPERVSVTPVLGPPKLGTSTAVQDSYNLLKAARIDPKLLARYYRQVEKQIGKES